MQLEPRGYQLVYLLLPLLLLQPLSTSSFCMIRTLVRKAPSIITSTRSTIATAIHMSTTNSHNCGIEQVAKRLVHNDCKSYVCIAVAGGGGHAISTLASTPGASSLFLEGTVTYDRNSLQAYIGEAIPDTFTFVSEETAVLMSRAAVRHALQYRANVEDYPHCVGVGITSALTTTKNRAKGSFGHIVATLADGSEWKCKVTLEPNKRDRAEEDKIMGKMVLQAIEQLQTKGKMKLVMESENDEIEESFQAVTPKDEVKAAAERILRGDAKTVLLLPTADKKFMAVTDPVLPMESLVFPGSFNPPHHGHTTLAHVASRAWKKNKAVFLELSLTNPDKPSMDPEDVSVRAHKFFELMEDLPEQWGILLTSAPLFKEKVEGLRPFMAPVHNGGPQLGFVIGTDTMVRILNPKYYGDDVEEMLESVREMGRSGVHFVVGGRLEQRPGGEQKFVTGEEDVAALPKDVQRIFTLVTEEDFRVDISSSEIRKRDAEKQV